MLTYILNKPQEHESCQAEGGSRGAGGGPFRLAPILTVPRQAPAGSPENYFLVLKKFFKISCQSFYVFCNNAVPSKMPNRNKIKHLFLLAEVRPGFWIILSTRQFLIMYFSKLSHEVNKEGQRCKRASMTRKMNKP